MSNDMEFERALFRFSLISPLLHCEDEEERRRIIRTIVRKQLGIPYSNKSTISAKTLENYLRQYQEEGFEGLKRTTRKDKKTVKSITDDVVQLIFFLKKEEPRRSARQIIRLIHAREAYRDVSLKERTVSRIIKNNGLTRRDIKPKKIHKLFEMDTINDLWETDISQGLFLSGAKCMTHCFAFIDDHSRVIPHGQFYYDEKLPRLEDCLKKAVLKRGIPKAIYADNGKIFVSNHFKRICAELGINLMHHLPYSPQSKGKIERFFLRMQKEFLLEAKGAGIRTVEELNSHFQSWIDIEYHRREHHSIGTTPLNRFTIALDTTSIRKVESVEEITEIFLYREKRKVHKSSGIIKMAGNQYQVTDVSLLGHEIEARFDPYDLSRIFVYRDEIYNHTALPVDLKNKQYHAIPEENKTKESQIRKSSIDFFERLKQKELEINRKESQRIDFTKISEKS